MNNIWQKNSWQHYILKNVPHLDKTEEILNTLSNKSILVPVETIENLSNQLEQLKASNSFIIQSGECAETFTQANFSNIVSRLSLSQTCAFLFEHLTKKPVIQIGRIAGQYAKPRSRDTETINGKEITSYKGDMLNSYKVTNRATDSTRLLQAYKAAAKSYEHLNNTFPYKNNKFFSSHESLVLPYETALTKEINNKHYNTSAAMLWLGVRSNFLGSSHIEYLRGIENPIGIKLGIQSNPEDFSTIIKTLNPFNKLGKIIVINRMGIKHTKILLPQFIQTIQKQKLNVLWMSDPMHGNTQIINGYKTRDLDNLIQEVSDFAQCLQEHNEYFAGIHLETTPNNVTECLSTSSTYKYANIVKIEDLKSNYQTLCDPRLNLSQTKELVYRCAELF